MPPFYWQLPLLKLLKKKLGNNVSSRLELFFIRAKHHLLAH